MIKKQMLHYSMSLLVVFCILFIAACNQGPDPPPLIISDTTSDSGGGGTDSTAQSNPADDPAGSVHLDIAWCPDHIIAGIPSSIVLAKAGGTAQLVVTGDYTAVECFVDGKALAGLDGTFTIDAAQYSAARHTVSIIVLKGGIPYSRECSFTITKE